MLPAEERSLRDRLRGGRADGGEHEQAADDEGGSEPAEGPATGPEEKEDEEHSRKRERSREEGVVAWKQRRRPPHPDEEGEARCDRTLCSGQHPDQRREAEDGEQDEPVHGRVVDAVERKGGVVEVLEAVPRCAQDRSEEVVAAPRPGFERRDVPGDSGSEDRREHEDSGDYRPSPSQRHRERR